MLAALTALLLASPVLVSAGIFARDSGVTMLNEQEFRSVMKQQNTAIVAFVAPWCGHCKNLSPEYSKAAKSLAPLVPFYAVDCDEEKNKPLCGQQGIKGFPTIKSFPKGNQGVPHDYNGERKAKAIADWAGAEVPNRVDTFGRAVDVTAWLKKKPAVPHLLLVNSQTKLPLLWRALSSSFKEKAAFSVTRSKDKAISLASELGATVDDDGKSKIIYWPGGESEPQIYDGVLKYEPLSTFVKGLVESASKSKDEL